MTWKRAILGTLGVAAVLLGLGAAYVLTAYGPQSQEGSLQSGKRAEVERSSVASGELPMPPTANAAVALAPVRANATAQNSGNALELSQDLRASYERFKGSDTSAERRLAHKAWAACFPLFIAPQGQPVQIATLTQALPPDDPNRDLRADAYRGLQARCRNFSDLPRDAVLRETQNLKEAAAQLEMLTQGEVAALHLASGRSSQALQVVRAVITAREPEAIKSLQEFVQQYLVMQVDAQMLPNTTRADLRAMAYSFSACQMGLECGADSLSALQLCASLGACHGSVTERYLQALPNPADRDALLAETRRVVDAIRSGDFEALGFSEAKDYVPRR